jgi:hypothetical protein
MSVSQNGDPQGPSDPACGTQYEGITLGIRAGIEALISLFEAPSLNGSLSSVHREDFSIPMQSFSPPDSVFLRHLECFLRY